MVYRRVIDFNGKTCVFRVATRGNEVKTWEEEGRCRIEYCGARGYLDNQFDVKSRRAIRYMPRLLASREYAEAVAEYEAQRVAPAR